MIIELIKQKCNKSCGIACIAMVSGKSFDDVMELSSFRDVSAQEMDELLDELDIRYERQLYPDLYANNTYIVVVPSLNGRAMNHYIVIQTFVNNKNKTDLKIYDPSTEDCYTENMDISWTSAVRIIGK